MIYEVITLSSPKDFPILPTEKNVDEELEFLCRYVKSDYEVSGRHGHSYYEIFMGVKGKYILVVNSVEQKLTEGTIVFIRDTDDHYYKRINSEYFEFMNIAFSKEFFNSIADFLGTGFKRERLFEASMPPMVNIPVGECKKLFEMIMDINSQDDKQILKSKMKVMLARVFSDYFFEYSEQKPSVPLWLEMMCEKMKKPANFIAGTEKMCDISGKSREHISRSMKKYYGISPSDFVNELRLAYSTALLITSNSTVTDICYESGFDNISWFYKKFEDKFGITPSKYRRMNKSDSELFGKPNSEGT